jgi:hypothetical protein
MHVAKAGTSEVAIFGRANLSTHYFNLRRMMLEQWLSKPNFDSLTAAGCRTRIRMIDNFTSTSVADPGLIENRLGLQCIWDHPIRGKDAFVSHELAQFVDLTKDWRTRFGWVAGTVTCSSDGRAGLSTCP